MDLKVPTNFSGYNRNINENIQDNKIFQNSYYRIKQRVIEITLKLAENI